jgi:hypothetical protein
MSNLLDALIAQGMKANEDFTKELLEIKKRVENTKEVQAIADLQEVTGVMQNVDEFTLLESEFSKQDAAQMKAVDMFTMQEVQDLKGRVTALESKDGGTA